MTHPAKERRLCLRMTLPRNALNRKGLCFRRSTQPLGGINFDFLNAGLEQLLHIVGRKKPAVKKEGGLPPGIKDSNQVHACTYLRTGKPLPSRQRRGRSGGKAIHETPDVKISSTSWNHFSFFQNYVITREPLTGVLSSTSLEIYEQSRWSRAARRNPTFTRLMIQPAF